MTDRLRDAGRRVGVVSQGRDATGTVESVFEAKQRQRALDQLSALGVPGESFGSSVQQLSDGQFQKVCLLRSIALRPDVLVWDEPTNRTLDVSNWRSGSEFDFE